MTTITRNDLASLGAKIDTLELTDNESAALDAIPVSASDAGGDDCGDGDGDEVSGFFKSKDTYHDRMGKLGFLLEVSDFTADNDMVGSLKTGDPTTKIVAQGGDGSI